MSDPEDFEELKKPRAAYTGFEVEYAKENSEVLTASDYRKRVKSTYKLKLPQSKFVVKAKLLDQGASNMLSMSMANLPKGKDNKMSKKAFQGLMELGDMYIPKIVIEPPIKAPPEDGSSLPDDVISTRDLTSSDLVALLTWGSSGEIPDEETYKALQSFREE